MKTPYMIKEKYIGSVWIKCLHKAIKEGVFVKDRHRGLAKEILNVIIFVLNPQVLDKLTAKFMDLKMFDWMQKNFFGKKSLEEWGYSYGQRLFDYNGIDQIKSLTGRLKTNPQVKSATITLMRPGFDNQHVPCLTTLDFKVRNKKLLLTCFFRSQDIYKKMCVDMLCLAKIQKNMAKQLRVNPGYLCFHIVSAHVYKEDFEKADEILRKVK